MKKLQRVFALIMAIVMMMGTMSMTAFATEAETEDEIVISQRIDKTADGLDANDQTNVTLTVPGEEISMTSDIVFIIGHGPANNYGYIMDMIHKMLIATDGTKTKIKIGMVGFADTTEDEIVMPLTEMVDTVPGNSVAEYRLTTIDTYYMKAGPDRDAALAENAIRRADYAEKVAAWDADPVLAKDMEYKIARALEQAEEVYSGVNLESALITARDMLAGDNTVPAERKHMIVISTGLTYYFDTEDGTPATIMGTNKFGDFMHGNKYWLKARNGETNTSKGYNIPAWANVKEDGLVNYQASWTNFWENYVLNWIEADQNKYVYKLVDQTYSEFLPWNEEKQVFDKNGTEYPASTNNNSNYRYGYALTDPDDIAAVGLAIPFFTAPASTGTTLAENAKHAMNYERAQYEALMIYRQMEAPVGEPVTTLLKDKETGENIVLTGMGFNCYAVAIGKTPGNGEEDVWLSNKALGYNFMHMMGGENTVNYNSGDTSFFKSIENKILYTCADGSTVTDYMGYDAEKGDFNFIQDPTTMTLVYGGETYAAEQIATKEGATASYGFNKKGENEYSFNLDYYAGEADAEHFIWTFHENVSMEKVASLTYKLQLTTKATADGEYTIETNEYAVLKPIDTKNQAGDWQYFPVPTVKYTVASKVTISGTKEWNDDANRDGIRPEEIVVILKADDEVVARQTVKAGESQWLSDTTWHFDFGEWPAKDESGKTIDYTVEEIEVEGYESVINGNAKDGFVIENTHTPETITISGTKIWDDEDNRDGKRPASITVALMKGDEQIGEPQTVTAANQWTYSFTAYKYENGKEITNYSVKEIDVPADYETTYSEENYDITNTYEPETVTVSGTKIWDDANNQDGKRPANIEVILLADGDKVAEQTVTGQGNEWSFEFTDLPKNKNVNGKVTEIVYTIAEIEVPDGYQSIPGDDNTITNKYTPGKISVTVTKKWVDGSNQDGVRPESITIILLADGEQVATQTISGEGNEWTCTFADLPEYANGQKIVYTVDEGAEAEAAGYTKSISDTTITNSRNVELTQVSGKKVWDDNNDQDGIRPDSIVVILKADGEEYARKTVTGQGNEWAFEFTGLPKYKNGQAIKYTVAEIEVEGYTSKVEGTTITNSQKEYASVTVSGRKVWDDGNDQDGLRPDVIEVILYADGVKVGCVSTNKELDNWTFKFTDLPANKDGKAIVYTVDEVEVEGYETEITGDATIGFTITNTHTPATVSVEGQKIWNDGNDQDGLRPDSITIKLLADGEQVATQTVTAESQWTFEFTNLPKFNNGETIVYSISEDAVTGYDAPAIAGSVEDGFTITNKHTPATVSVEGTKTWNDDSNRDGIRPDEITIRLKADGTEIDAKTVTGEGNAWTYSFDNLPMYRDGGVQIVYSITEDAVENYTTTPSSGYDVTNTYAPGKTSVSVSKIWDDGEDYDGIRPEEITVILLANGQETGKTVTLSADNRWTATFTDLFMKEGGEAIEYTVAEVEVEGYETEITGDATIGFTITNTHEPNYYEEDVVTVRKVWSGDTAANRPASVTVQLKNSRTGAVQATATLSAANGWSATFYVPANEFWTVEEVNVPANYTSRVSSPNGFDFTVTNTYTTQIEEPRVPMGTPGDDTIILDDDVPLADVPKTGDPLTVMAAMSILSGAGVFFTRKKREDEE